MKSHPDILTTGEVAKLCAVCHRTAAKWIDSGLLPGYRVPGSRDRRVRRADLEAFAKAHGMSVGEGTETEAPR